MDWINYISEAKEQTNKRMNSMNAKAFRQMKAMKYGINKSKTLERWAYRNA